MTKFNCGGSRYSDNFVRISSKSCAILAFFDKGLFGVASLRLALAFQRLTWRAKQRFLRDRAAIRTSEKNMKQKNYIKY